MSNLDYTLGLLTNVFTQFFDGLLNQDFTYPSTKDVATPQTSTGCTWNAGGSSCTGTITGTVLTGIKPACNDAKRNSKTLCENFEFLSGCSWNGACTGTAVDGIPCTNGIRSISEATCAAYGRGDSTRYVHIGSSGCAWNSANTVKCTGTQSTAGYSVCTHPERSSEGFCTSNFVNSTATYNGCVFSDLTSTKTCVGGSALTDPASGSTPTTCSSLTGTNPSACGCEKFCIVNQKPNAYYTALNEMFNNYTRYSDFSKVNYKNVGFSGMIFLSSVLNFKSPGSTN